MFSSSETSLYVSASSWHRRSHAIVTSSFDLESIATRATDFNAQNAKRIYYNHACR